MRKNKHSVEYFVEEVSSPRGIIPGEAPFRLLLTLKDTVAAFYSQTKKLPVVILVPRELKDGEVMSWSYHLSTKALKVLAPPEEPEEKPAKGQSPDRPERLGPKKRGLSHPRPEPRGRPRQANTERKRGRPKGSKNKR